MLGQNPQRPSDFRIVDTVTSAKVVSGTVGWVCPTNEIASNLQHSEMGTSCYIAMAHRDPCSVTFQGLCRTSKTRSPASATSVAGTPKEMSLPPRSPGPNSGQPAGIIYCASDLSVIPVNWVTKCEKRLGLPTWRCPIHGGTPVLIQLP